jgi:hypothetical protein
MRSESMSKFLGGTGAALGVKIVTGFAIAAAASVMAAEVVVTGSANPADWGRQVSHRATFAGENAPAASAPQPAANPPGQSGTSATAGSANAQGSLNPNDSAQDNHQTSRPTTTWIVPEPNDPPFVAVQTKFIPKP